MSVQEELTAIRMPTEWTCLEATCASAMMAILATEQLAVSSSYNVCLSQLGCTGTWNSVHLRLINRPLSYKLSCHHAMTKRNKLLNIYSIHTHNYWSPALCSHTTFALSFGCQSCVHNALNLNKRSAKYHVAHAKFSWSPSFPLILSIMSSFTKYDSSD